MALVLHNVEVVNNHKLPLTLGKDLELYFSFVSVCKTNANMDSIGDLYNIEFLNSIKLSEKPNHELKLKVRLSIMLLRKINKFLGLSNDIHD